MIPLGLVLALCLMVRLIVRAWAVGPMPEQYHWSERELLWQSPVVEANDHAL